MRSDELSLLSEHRRNRFFGKYRGIVKDNDDQANMGRLQVLVPSVLEDQLVWAMPCVPYAGDQVGFYCLPDKDAGVWVEFEGGNPRFPIWVGCYWLSGQLPQEATSPSIRVWRTPKLTFSIDDDNSESLFQTGDNMKISMSSSDGIQTSFQNVKHTVSSDGVTSDSGGSGKVEVTSQSTSVNGGALQVS